jgi:glycyl-tRNA synthetase beta chain
LRTGLGEQLRDKGIGFGAIEPFATPRRLALLVRELATRQPDQVTLRRGPAVKAAFGSDGSPTQAVLGFARSCGVAVEALDREETEKGSWLAYRQRPGRRDRRPARAHRGAALARLPIPKRMRWGAGEAEFVRPVQWVCMVFGRDAVQGSILGVQAGRLTRGHRFHAPGPFVVEEAAAWPRLLRAEGRVEPHFDSRKGMIREQVQALAARSAGRVVMDEDLLEEVTALCEWPTAIEGSFEERFLAVPPRC